MINEPVRYCEHCNQKIRPLNPHRIDKSKVETLEAIARLNTEKKVEWVKIQQDHRLIPFDEAYRTLQQDAVHALRLKWFGLLDYRGERTGEFRVNDIGLAFLVGRISVPETIHCRDGAVVEISEERVVIDDVKNVILDKEYWDNYHSIQVYEEKETLGVKEGT